LSYQKQVEHLFRHEYGKLVALLVRRIGVQYLDSIEDAIQWAMAQALECWRKGETPSSPSAWLYQVAYRYLLSELKSTQRKSVLLAEHYSTTGETLEHKDIPFASEMSDSMLRMLFVACNDSVPVESQLVFILKSLCGFSIREVALRLFISEANAYKRLSRAKQHLKSQTLELEMLSNNDISARLPLVQSILYLIFTEGYLSSHTETAIRRDLCEEAIRLTKLLVASQFGDVPDSYALLALMYFHLARINSRQDNVGVLLLLEQQNRDQWNKEQISMAMAFLAQSANGNTISRYHVEAGIAAEHCLSPSFEQTKWEKIIAAYELLHRISPSPIHLLNRAIATAQWQSPQAGLVILESSDIPAWLDRCYYWYAVQADLLFRSGEVSRGQKHAELAIAAAPTKSIKKLLFKRLLAK